MIKREEGDGWIGVLGKGGRGVDRRMVEIIEYILDYY